MPKTETVRCECGRLAVRPVGSVTCCPCGRCIQATPKPIVLEADKELKP
ncbi:MAG: hypothetical protein PHF00_13850 [Elusimicrobia bacterium]|nr:hypothetical protein [Elusimicrobiota bacterium]